MSMYDLTGRKALVTGGARGLGAGMAAALARAGAAWSSATYSACCAASAWSWSRT